MPTAAFYTLGCKVNQYETEKIREELELRGFQTVPYPGPADVLIINSCTVTGMADAKSRAAIRRAIRRNPDAIVIATGCSVELDPDTYSKFDGIDMIVSNAKKTEIAERVAARFPDLPDSGPSEKAGLQQNKTSPKTAAVPRQRTRAVVKVQDGCNQFCAYCAVALARPNLSSRKLDDVKAEVQSLADYGYKEVVLTGIRLGSYNADAASLADLVYSVTEIEGISRIRLSSIEVWEITPELIEAFKHPKVCRHLHIPLQSGSNNVLQNMRRPYTAELYMHTIRQAQNAIDGLAVSTDVMAGFPGESEEDFKCTFNLLKDLAFSRLHVFRFSARPNTPAAGMPNQISAHIKERRSQELIALGDRLSGEFAERMVGENVKVLVEQRRTRATLLSGLTDNYVEVELPGPDNLRGQIVQTRIIDRRGSLLIGGGD